MMTLLHIPISIGDLIDKITILEIKTRQLQGGAQENSAHELTLLLQTLESAGLAVDAAAIDELREVNGALWRIEDEIRDHERRQVFNERFIALARAIYRHNDQRAAIKRRINLQHGSAIVEEKGYQPY